MSEEHNLPQSVKSLSRDRKWGTADLFILSKVSSNFHGMRCTATRDTCLGHTPGIE